MTKAEDKNLAVACASVISRYIFLKEFDKLSDSLHIPLPKGAGAQVDSIGEEVVEKYGEDKLKEVAKNIPLDKILVETDDPYLPPVPFRGKQNHPKYVTYVVKELANLRNLSYEETSEITYKNALKVFDL